MEPVTVLETRYGQLKKQESYLVTESSGGATLAGAVIGGVLGNQVGGGSGKTVATIAGTLAGGAVANAATAKDVTHYQYHVEMDDGTKFMLQTGERSYRLQSKVVVEHLSNGRERINVIGR